MAEIHVKGLSALNEFLQTLPQKVERNILRQALRQGANVIRDQARQNVPVKSGELRKSLKVGTRAKNGRVTASVRTKLHYAKWMEYGTAAHKITAKGGGWLSFGGIFAKSVQHPGIAPYGSKSSTGPHSFLRPAMDAKAGAAVVAVGERIKQRLTKEGLNTADVDIGIES